MVNRKRKIPQQDFDKYLEFLDEHKKYAGLPDWNVKLATQTVQMDSYAEVDVDIYEKEMMVTLSHDYMKEPESRQYNILLHELVHGRMSAYTKKVEEHVTILEEHFVNDLTRGLEMLVKDKDKKRKK